MSLFQARHWWSAKPDTAHEEFDCGCLAVANIDNDAGGLEKIITGSIAGMLRVYQPKQQENKLEDLVLEQNLGAPILQIEVGRFLPNSSDVALLVLHPRSVAVYSVNAIGQNQYFEATRQYQHQLTRTAANLCFGPFGQVHARDFFCVQSMDGQLSFFEQDSAAFSRYLPNSLLPGPLCYCARTDSFITCNSEMVIEAYKYQVLSAASSAPSKHTGKDYAGFVSAKPVQTDWSVNIGEQAVDIKVGRYSQKLNSSQIDIIVLGQHTLFTLADNGEIRFQKRLDFDPICSCLYAVGSPSSSEGGSSSSASTDRHNLIVGTDQQSLMVMRDMKLVWAAKHSAGVPCAVRVAQSVGPCKGMLVTMCDDGTVSVSFLGTEPIAHSVSAADQKELDYDEMDKEHRSLLGTIRQAQTNTMREPTDKLTLRAQVPEALDAPMRDDTFEDFGTDGDAARDPRHGNLVVATIKFYISYQGESQSEPLQNVQLAISHSDGFYTDRNNLVLDIPCHDRATPVAIPIKFLVSSTVLPSSVRCSAVVTYSSPSNSGGNQGEPRTAQCDFDLPMPLVCRVVPPLKNPAFMLTLATNRQAPDIVDIFPSLMKPALELNPDLSRSQSSVISVQYWAQNLDCTILVSKKGGKYRLQAGSFSALWLLTWELVKCLNRMFEVADEGQKSFLISYEDSLPLQDFFAVIDAHVGIRQQISALHTVLERRAHQFRVVQKRLLAKFRDKNPAPLGQLGHVARHTFDQQMAVGQQVQSLQAELKQRANELACAVQVTLLLIRTKFDLDDLNAGLLEHYLSPRVDTGDMGGVLGWEESCDASMTHLLRTVLAKSARDQAIPQQPLDQLTDTAKLKRHIKIVCDRLSKGYRLYREPKKKKSKKESKAK